MSTELKVEITGTKGQATEYVILQKLDGPADEASKGHWVEVGRKHAASADAAIRAQAAEKDGVFLAIPARSWQPRTVKVETKKIVRLA